MLADTITFFFVRTNVSQINSGVFAVYAMTGLVGQSLIAAYFAVILALGPTALGFRSIAQYAIPYVVDVHSLSGSIFIMIAR